MKTLANYIEETIRRYGAVGSNRGMGFTLEEAFKQGDKVTVYNKPVPVDSASAIPGQVREGAGVFNIGDQVLYKGQPAEVLAVDGTAATVYVPNWKAVPGMVDDTMEVDPASKFLNPMDPAVAEAAPGDPETNADNNDPLLAKAIDLAPVKALEESAELRLILQRAKLIE